MKFPVADLERIALLTLLSITLMACGVARYASEVGPPPPALSTLSVSPYHSLKERLDHILNDSLFPPSNVGIKVVSLDRHELLYALNERALFNPASNQKLFTSSIALRLLGPQYQFSTGLFVDTASHTIYLQGQGDPLISTEDLDSLARQVAPMLSASHPWTLAVDASYFDDLYWGAGWTWDEEPAAYGMFVSPLMVDNNAITVTARPGAAVGDSVMVGFTPPVNFMTVENNAITVEDTGEASLKISRKWRERSNTITVAGQLHRSSRQRSERLSVWQPELYAGRVFAERLSAAGVPVGTVCLDTLAPQAQKLIAYTHTLDTVITFMNKESDNLSAEAVLKTIGAQCAGLPGSAEKGVKVLYDTLSAWGVDTNSISIVDGSGLSRYNLTSASTIMTLLQHMHEDSTRFGVFWHSLPIAGVDGTIGNRMKGSPAEGNLRAKTGTLSAVSALSGYVRSADGELLAFSILIQNFPGSSRRYRTVQDAVGIFLSSFSRATL